MAERSLEALQHERCRELPDGARPFVHPAPACASGQRLRPVCPRPQHLVCPHAWGLSAPSVSAPPGWEGVIGRAPPRPWVAALGSWVCCSQQAPQAEEAQAAVEVQLRAPTPRCAAGAPPPPPGLAAAASKQPMPPSQTAGRSALQLLQQRGEQL